MAEVKKGCKICRSNNVAQINRRIHRKDSIASIAKIWGFSRATVKKHKEVCLLPDISEKQEIIKTLTSSDRVQAYDDRFHKTEKMIDALDLWMRDPDNPDKYSIDDRANEIDVVYQEYDKENMRMRPGKQKATLQDLICKVEAGGEMYVRELTSRRTDPRKLLLDALKEEREMIKLVVEMVQRVKEYDFKNRALSKADTEGGTITFEKQIDTITERVIVAMKESNTEELSEIAGLPELV